jgi:hypothetical protein
MKALEGGLKQGVWQSDRDAYSEEHIEAGNAIFEMLAQKHNPAWKELIWDIKEPQPLKLVK